MIEDTDTGTPTEEPEDSDFVGSNDLPPQDTPVEDEPDDDEEADFEEDPEED